MSTIYSMKLTTGYAIPPIFHWLEENLVRSLLMIMPRAVKQHWSLQQFWANCKHLSSESRHKEKIFLSLWFVVLRADSELFTPHFSVLLHLEQKEVDPYVSAFTTVGKYCCSKEASWRHTYWNYEATQWLKLAVLNVGNTVALLYDHGASLVGSSNPHVYHFYDKCV